MSLNFIKIEERYTNLKGEIYYQVKQLSIIVENQCGYCKNYVGYVGFNTIKLCCAIHPYGNSDLCSDFEVDK